ncbi:MAG TPA: hypothetical protein VMV81_05745 [Phycisphaerae bacterium]|nr:hypothetical protein [Phycisphaerae bacterium]
MSNPNTLARGNIMAEWALNVTLSPTSVPNATTAEQTFTVNGLQLGDNVSVNKPTTQAGLFIANSRVSAANTLAIAFGNVTSATITPTASESYSIVVTRVENLTMSNTSPLSQVP